LRKLKPEALSIGLLALTKDNGTWWMNRLRRISWCWDGQDLYASGLRVDYYRHFGIMLIFKGGQPGWSGTPFAAASGRDAVELFEHFAKNIQSFFQ
jgi:hypothetical protein